MTKEDIQLKQKDALSSIEAAFTLLVDLNYKEECRLQDKIDELEDLVLEMREKKPIWGSCRAGCADSYLDPEGYCSPACHYGAPRGLHPVMARVAQA